MTPALSAVYDELIRRAAEPPFVEMSGDLRRQFAKRTGAVPDDHPAAAGRIAAGWEDALVRGDLASRIMEMFDDTAERAMVQVISRAQRGLFELDVSDEPVVVRDLWGGGEFLLLKRDDVSRTAPRSLDASGSLFVGRIVGSDEGCAVLPGMLWLPSEAAPLLADLRKTALEREMTLDAFADAILRMDLQVRTLARVKLRYAFRVEAL